MYKLLLQQFGTIFGSMAHLRGLLIPYHRHRRYPYMGSRGARLAKSRVEKLKELIAGLHKDLEEIEEWLSRVKIRDK